MIMTRTSDICWLSHQSAVDALRWSLVSELKLVMEQEASSGNAIALGLSFCLKKPTFVATFLFSLMFWHFKVAASSQSRWYRTLAWFVVSPMPMTKKRRI